MAESANVRQNLQNIPSIFEISAAETLDNLIYPALSKIFEYFGLRLDFTLWGTSKRVREELSPLLTWTLQYLYLRKRASSFGESFYGLQRTAYDGSLLTKQQQFISASLLTFLPYFERKLKSRSAHHLDTSKWEKQLLNALHAYNASKSVCTFLYLIKYAVSHSPIFRALGLTLRYPVEPPQEDKTTYIFLKLLEVFAFFLQFIQWWYSNDQRRKMGGMLKNPDAINDPVVDRLKQSQDIREGYCPICLMEIDSPTACALSGYVYCWKCIFTHLKTQSSCPVTGYAITLEDLVRIYDS